MNRIRSFNNKYQILISNNNINYHDVDELLNNWLDISFNNYHIEETDNLQDALYESLKYQDIDWYKIVSYHVENYKKLKAIIENLIKKYNYTVELKSDIVTPDDLKNNIFDRVMLSHKFVNLANDVNDIISYTITNSWTKNLNHMAQLFEKDVRLRIFSKQHKNNSFYLTGKTEIGTSYSIIFMPTLINNAIKWLHNNKHNTNIENIFPEIIKKAIDLQTELDKQPLVL